MSKKPNVKTAMKIHEIQNEITELYEQLDAEKQKLFDKYGENTFVYELDDGGYLRLKLTDNLNSFKEGNTIFRTTSVHRFDMKVEVLTKKPKELKEVEE